MEEGAFDRPMTFSEATSKGNSGVSFWVAATGQIGPETPAKFREFLDTNGIAGGQLVLHSPSGNLAAGLELGQTIRD